MSSRPPDGHSGGAFLSTTPAATPPHSLPTRARPRFENRCVSPRQDGVELATASGDLAGLVSRLGGIEPIVRGAAYSRAQAMDASFAAQVSASSPLFNLPVETVQRGRDHGEGGAQDERRWRWGEGAGVGTRRRWRVENMEEISTQRWLPDPIVRAPAREPGGRRSLAEPINSVYYHDVADGAWRIRRGLSREDIASIRVRHLKFEKGCCCRLRFFAPHNLAPP